MALLMLALTCFVGYRMGRAGDYASKDTLQTYLINRDELEAVQAPAHFPVCFYEYRCFSALFPCSHHADVLFFLTPFFLGPNIMPNLLSAGSH